MGTYFVDVRVGVFAVEGQGWNVSELFSELVLLDVERVAARADVLHLLRLQRRHVLPTLDRQLLRVRPTRWQVLHLLVCFLRKFLTTTKKHNN